tara:strand:+ start:169 stop:291 length:123 start_codon:yes stop_codon:yes gene_type:complete
VVVAVVVLDPQHLIMEYLVDLVVVLVIKALVEQVVVIHLQ